MSSLDIHSCGERLIFHNHVTVGTEVKCYVETSFSDQIVAEHPFKNALLCGCLGLAIMSATVSPRFVQMYSIAVHGMHINSLLTCTIWLGVLCENQYCSTLNVQ